MSNEAKKIDPVKYVVCSILYEVFKGKSYSYYPVHSLRIYAHTSWLWTSVYLSGSSMHTCQTFTYKRGKKRKN